MQEAIAMDIEPTWTNPDFAVPKVGFMVSKQEIMPSVLNGCMLTPEARDTTVFCVQYKYGEGRCKARVLQWHA
eukprot:8902895-Karenia_brevis.AAC.1